MSEFKRGINNPEFINALNKCDYWQKMVKDPQLFIGIRDEYINVYYKGNSICKLSYDCREKRIKAAIHYKYLLNPGIKNPYLETSDGTFPPDVLKGKSIKSLSEIDLIKRASSAYAGEEKTGVHSIILKEKNILDIEVTFSKETIDTDSNKTDRIDYLQLIKHGGKIILVFFEAKHFTNSEIRARQSPRVLNQLKRYETAIKDHEKTILDSYKTVCRNLKALNIVGDRNLINEVAETPNLLSIDPLPRLMIFGYDRDQDEGKVWNAHKKVLKDVLGDRFITRGGC